MFHSSPLERQVSNKFSNLFWLNSKCPTSAPLCSAGTSSVQQLLHPVLMERQVSTNISRNSGGTANVQHVCHSILLERQVSSHSILLERQVSNKCLTLLHWKSRCPTSVPLYISQGPCSRRDVPEDPG